MGKEQEYNAEGQKLNKEDEEKLIERVYTQAIEERQKNLEELDRRYYPVASPTTISDEQLKESVERQVDVEMARRKERAQESDTAVYRNANAPPNSVLPNGKRKAPVELTQSEVDESVNRLYTESVRQRDANMEESRRRYLFDREAAVGEPKKMSAADMKDSVNRMSQPKKMVFTTAEANKIYGLQ